MTTEIKTTTLLSIKECGHDEFWLRDIIFDHPEILGLGDLQGVTKEFTQPQGGRLDLLLMDPDDDMMYEVELQLGETDERHIIHAIEYWDNNRKLWPKRSHTAVLVAEKINSRFVNVIHLLSNTVPVKGIQVNFVQVGDERALHFTTIIDSYAEPVVVQPDEKGYGEAYWVENFPGALECARWYRNLLTRFYGDIPTKYFRDYIALTVGTIKRVWVSKRKNERARVEIKYAEKDITEATDHLDKQGIAFSVSNDHIWFNVDSQQLKNQEAVHDWIAPKLAPQYLANLKGAQPTFAGVQPSPCEPA